MGGIRHSMASHAKKNKKPAFIARCTDCSNEFEVSLDGSTSSVLEGRWFLIDNCMYLLKYFDCPKCMNRMILSIDDEKTSVEAKKLEDKLNQINARKSGKPTKSQSGLVKKLSEDLASSRIEVYASVVGSFYFDVETGLDYKVDLKKEDDVIVRKL